MSGHVGDLSQKQAAALAELKQDIQADDHTLLRFLRAREFNVNDAKTLYKEWLEYRKTSGIELLLRSQIPKQDMFNKFVPNALHGFDKDGRPIYWEKTGMIDYSTAYKYMDDKEFMANHLWQQEKQIERCRESSQKLGKVVDQFCTVVDLKGLNMSHRRALKFIRMCADHDQKYYPERLGKVYLVNAPWVFPWFWKVCKRWLNQNTRDKIHVLGKNYKKELLQYIPAESIPEEYGGTCVCEGGACIPVHDITELKAGPNFDEEFEAAEKVQHHLAARATFEKRIDIGSAGGTVEWMFKTTSKDVSFSVEVIETVEIEADGKSDEAKVFIVEAERLEKHKGSYTVDSEAIVILRWDNSYSRFTSKAVHYHVRTVELPESERRREYSQLSLDEKQNSLIDPSVADGSPRPENSPRHGLEQSVDA